MSGGRFNYKDSDAKNEIFGWFYEGKNIPNIFEDREISELIWDVFDLIHDYDWYISGDTSEESYLESKTSFKNKWFNNRQEVDKEIIDKAIRELKDDLYKTFGHGVKDEID